MTQHTIAEICDIRRQLVKKIADEFDASNVEYTNGQAVMMFARKRIIPLTDHMPASVKIHRHMTFRNIERATWYEVNRRWLKRRREK